MIYQPHLTGGPMKKTILIVSLLSSLIAQANNVKSTFKPNSALPQEWQSTTLDYVISRCPQITPYSMSEIVTQVSDQDETSDEITYHIVFSASYYPDGMHPYRSQVSVELRLTKESNALYSIGLQTHDPNICQQ